MYKTIYIYIYVCIYIYMCVYTFCIYVVWKIGMQCSNPLLIGCFILCTFKRHSYGYFWGTNPSPIILWDQLAKHLFVNACMGIEWLRKRICFWIGDLFNFLFNVVWVSFHSPFVTDILPLNASKWSNGLSNCKPGTWKSKLTIVANTSRDKCW